MPFRAATEAGVRSVMTAHVVFPAIDTVPATISRRFLSGLLREELGFGGVIITDALEMAAIGDSAASAEGAVRALAAGADLLCLPGQWAAQQQARDSLARAVRDGAVPARRVEESAARVRALAAWARASPVPAPEPALGAEAARRGCSWTWRACRWPARRTCWTRAAGATPRGLPARRAGPCRVRRRRDPARQPAR